jgi:hypothetical protein
MRCRVATSLVLALVLLALPAPLCAPLAKESAPQALSHEAARQVVLDEIMNLPSSEARVDRILVLAFSSDRPVAVREEARKILLDYYPRLVVDRSAGVYQNMPPADQLVLLGLYDLFWPKMQGFSYVLSDIFTSSLSSPDEAVRTSATEICARYALREAYFPLRRRANRSKGADRIEAIRGLGKLHDARGATFLPTLLDDKERGVREAVYEALVEVGRPSSLVLKERMSHPDKTHRILAVEALMRIATVEDLSSLYSFVQTTPDLPEPLKTNLYTLIAELEVRRDKAAASSAD